MKTPKGYCEQCQLNEVAAEVHDASGLQLHVETYGQTTGQGYMAAAYAESDHERKRPQFSAFAPKKLEAARAVLEAMKVSTFA